MPARRRAPPPGLAAEMLRSTVLLLAVLTLACAKGKDKASTDPSDTGTAYEGDNAGECADGADNDRDGDFDCDDPDCAASPDCDGSATVTFSGSVEGTRASGDGDEPCSGLFELTWNPGSGIASGVSECNANGIEVANGDVQGTVSGDELTGQLDGYTQGSPFSLDVTGTRDGDLVELTFAGDTYYGWVTGTMSGSAE